MLYVDTHFYFMGKLEMNNSRMYPNRTQAQMGTGPNGPGPKLARAPNGPGPICPNGPGTKWTCASHELEMSKRLQRPRNSEVESTRRVHPGTRQPRGPLGLARAGPETHPANVPPVAQKRLRGT